MKTASEEGRGHAHFWSIGGLGQYPGIDCRKPLEMGLWPRAVLPMGPGPLTWDTQANREVTGIKINSLAVLARCNSLDSGAETSLKLFLPPQDSLK